MGPEKAVLKLLQLDFFKLPHQCLAEPRELSFAPCLFERPVVEQQGKRQPGGSSHEEEEVVGRAEARV